MKISKEAKIGISALVVIVIVYWGISFLKGMNVLKNKEIYYISISDATGVMASTAITTKGVTIGSVVGVELPSMESDILVKLVINSEYKIPKDSYIAIKGGSIMDTPKLALIAGDSAEVLSEGDTINFRTSSSMMESIDAITTKLTSVLSKVDTLMGNVNRVVNDDTIENLNETFKNLNEVTASASDLIGSQKVRLDRIMTNMDNITKTFSDATPEFKATLSNLESMTGSMNVSLPAILTDIENILSKVKSEDGTVGKLLNNEDLYNNLDTTLINLSILLEDLKNNPKNYVQFSVFEKRSPAEKELHRLEKKKIKNQKN